MRDKECGRGKKKKGEGLERKGEINLFISLLLGRVLGKVSDLRWSWFHTGFSYMILRYKVFIIYYLLCTLPFTIYHLLLLCILCILCIVVNFV